MSLGEFKEGNHYKEITREDLEIFICGNLDLYEESLVLIREKEEPRIFLKEEIDELFEIINQESILRIGYINESEDEIKISLVAGNEILLEIV